MLDIFKGALKQIYSIRSILIALYIPCFLILGGVGIVTKIIPHLTIPDLLRDVATLADLPFYSGAVSQLGLLLWSAATTLCFFTYFILRKFNSSRKATLDLLLSAGLLSAYLMLDDTYMLHEEFFPDYINILPEKAIIILLGLAMLAFLYLNRQELLQNEYGLMLLAFIFFGFSVAIDAIPTRLYENIYFIEKIEHLLEDGAKFTAIVTWIAFYARYSYQQLSSLVSIKSLDS